MLTDQKRKEFQIELSALLLKYGCEITPKIILTLEDAKEEIQVTPKNTVEVEEAKVKEQA